MLYEVTERQREVLADELLGLIRVEPSMNCLRQRKGDCNKYIKMRLPKLPGRLSVFLIVPASLLNYETTHIVSVCFVE